MQRCGYRLVGSGQVSIGWAGTKTGAFLVTADDKVIWINVGPDGTYGLDVYAQNVNQTSDKEAALLFLGYKNLPAFMRSFHKGPKYLKFEAGLLAANIRCEAQKECSVLRVSVREVMRLIRKMVNHLLPGHGSAT